jgi:hypothetical protein
MELYNYYTNKTDTVTVNRAEAVGDDFDFSPYVGASQATSNLYKLYILEGYGALRAAIYVLELIVENE